MPLLNRLAERARPPIDFTIDGQACRALKGDTILTAVLTQADQLRVSEFEHRARAGFCLMGACQDCWIDTEAGARLRACTTMIADGMRIRTRPIAAQAAESVAPNTAVAPVAAVTMAISAPVPARRAI